MYLNVDKKKYTFNAKFLAPLWKQYTGYGKNLSFVR